MGRLLAPTLMLVHLAVLAVGYGNPARDLAVARKPVSTIVTMGTGIVTIEHLYHLTTTRTAHQQHLLDLAVLLNHTVVTVQIIDTMSLASHTRTCTCTIS